jgi:sugar phosphate permease
LKDIVASGVLRPLTAIFSIQSVVTTAGYAVPVIAPQAAPAMGLAPEAVGFLVATIFFAAMVSSTVSGIVVARFGPQRTFQYVLIGTAAACLLLISSTAVAAFVAALLLGCATGPVNPLGSHVLTRVVPSRWRAFVFSIKQCATPTGGMIAGVVIPPLMLVFGWQIAVSIIPLAACALLLVTPMAAHGVPGGKVPEGNVLGAMARSLRTVLVDASLRRVVLTGTSLAACQMALASYLVVYLWRIAGLSPELAGLIFSSLHVAGIVSRIVLGAVADRYVSSQFLLAALSLIMAISLAVMTQISADWPLSAIFAVTIMAGVSGNGWVGLFFSELARIGPQDRTAEIAGGGQSDPGGAVVGFQIVLPGTKRTGE